MRYGLRLTLAAAALTAGLANAALALQPLRDVPEIDDNMLWVALAIEISDRCDSIAPRRLKGLSFLWELKERASDLGYSDDVIRAYVDSEAEKDRIRERGEEYMRVRGLDPTNDDDLCELGRDEIQKGSQIGAFLRAK
ncbi:DUF5333 domain-containing protein [Lutimaribacter sp. EGI FJ00015]|uniref:DUF5333 domain-containing protein n=1 Tax=Lutimaribacter degradans TaxID=2945989 RepID=A0ACC5ZRV2_9RHOB|nr:DUF5333 domain-containing protein [Lutimaribacter sp. EGI FJ00013]MCM2560865.1 DUF5333 domain-containing protein [Lutimaribacter sp. EGI FJ00013]MCO0612190.1 DUF5333 domain-containing protein [Lutimaribacter sp. EGI FJ00015]MCO0634690.1 DUF5333 domain-containing protein [Lutimaribacter sp. EGI FJ00014]